MAGPEGKIKEACAKYLKRITRKHKIWFYKVHGSGRQKMGIPDLCVIFYGIPVYIELKATADDPPTPIQLERMRQIEKAGGFCGVAYTVDRVRELLLEAWDDHYSGLAYVSGEPFQRPELEPV